MIAHPTRATLVSLTLIGRDGEATRYDRAASPVSLGRVDLRDEQAVVLPLRREHWDDEQPLGEVIYLERRGRAVAVVAVVDDPGRIGDRRFVSASYRATRVPSTTQPWRYRDALAVLDEVSLVHEPGADLAHPVTILPGDPRKRDGRSLDTPLQLHGLLDRAASTHAERMSAQRWSGVLPPLRVAPDPRQSTGAPGVVGVGGTLMHRQAGRVLGWR